MDFSFSLLNRMFETWEECMKFSEQFDKMVGYNHLTKFLESLKMNGFKIPNRLQYRSQPVDVHDQTKGVKWFYLLSWDRFIVLLTALDSPTYFITSTQTAVTVEYSTIESVLEHISGNDFFYLGLVHQINNK
jgi:hypothetical protein